MVPIKEFIQSLGNLDYYNISIHFPGWEKENNFDFRDAKERTHLGNGEGLILNDENSQTTLDTVWYHLGKFYIRVRLTSKLSIPVKKYPERPSFNEMVAGLELQNIPEIQDTLFNLGKLVTSGEIEPNIDLLERLVDLYSNRIYGPYISVVKVHEERRVFPIVYTNGLLHCSPVGLIENSDNISNDLKQTEVWQVLTQYVVQQESKGDDAEGAIYIKGKTMRQALERTLILYKNADTSLRILGK